MRVALALALVACTTTKTAEQHAEVGLETHAEQKAEVQSAESGHRTMGPELELQFGNASPQALSLAQGPSDTSRLGIGLHAGGASTRVDASDTLPPHGLLLKAIYRGPAAEDWMRNTSGTSGAEQQTSLKGSSEAHSSLTRSWWPPWWLLACLALGAAVALWALRRKISALKGLL